MDMFSGIRSIGIWVGMYNILSVYEMRMTKKSYTAYMSHKKDKEEARDNLFRTKIFHQKKTQKYEIIHKVKNIFPRKLLPHSNAFVEKTIFLW